MYKGKLVCNVLALLHFLLALHVWIAIKLRILIQHKNNAFNAPMENFIIQSAKTVNVLWVLPSLTVQAVLSVINTKYLMKLHQSVKNVLPEVFSTSQLKLVGFVLMQLQLLMSLNANNVKEIQYLTKLL